MKWDQRIAFPLNKWRILVLFWEPTRGCKWCSIQLMQVSQQRNASSEAFTFGNKYVVLIWKFFLYYINSNMYSSEYFRCFDRWKLQISWYDINLDMINILPPKPLFLFVKISRTISAILLHFYIPKIILLAYQVIHTDMCMHMAFCILEKITVDPSIISVMTKRHG